MKKCAECNGSGFIIKYNETTKEDEAVPCVCRLEREERDLIRTKLISAGVETKYWEYTFDNYLSLIDKKAKSDNQVSIDTFRVLIEDPIKFMKSLDYGVLWIWGRSPTAGHTSLATMLATEILKKNYSARFLTMQNLLAAFTTFDTKVEFFKDLSLASFYILDNAFDSNRCSAKGEYTIIHLYNWLNDVLSSGKKIICASKIPIREIDIQFQQSKSLLLSYGYEIEFKGEIVKKKESLI